MPASILTPYDDSMRLGQGYNSFLHIPCVHDAIKIGQGDVTITKPNNTSPPISQAVNYSSRFVDKISEVAKSMNVSAGSSIKNGSIISSGSTLSFDEGKFASSHLNAIVSVKVINQTVELVDTVSFVPMKDIKFSTEKFLKIYGNCYISGFIEGGDFTGILSARILEAAHRKEVEKQIKGAVNSPGTKSDFMLGESKSRSSTSAALSKTESTVTVSWSGGGQIKDENEPWTLDSMFKAAAAFPEKVSKCPQKTWAILTPFNHNKDFVKWADGADVQLPKFEMAQPYMNDLLDMYMDYKNLINCVQTILSNPWDYSLDGDCIIHCLSNAQPLEREQVLQILGMRKQMKQQMNLISSTVDEIASDPHWVNKIESESAIEPPELWISRLPNTQIIMDENFDRVQNKPTKDIIEDFSHAEDALVSENQDANTGTQVPPGLDSTVSEIQKPNTGTQVPAGLDLAYSLPAPCLPETENILTEPEKELILSPKGRIKFQSLFFDKPAGNATGEFVCGIEDILSKINVNYCWPHFFKFWKGPIESQEAPGLKAFQTCYLGVFVTIGTDPRTVYTGLRMKSGEYVTKVRIGIKPLKSGLQTIHFVELTTSVMQTFKYGTEYGTMVTTWSSPAGYPGLKCLYGYQTMDPVSKSPCITRIAPIWGVLSNIPAPCSTEVETAMSTEEKKMILSSEGKLKFCGNHFDKPIGNPTGTFKCQLELLLPSPLIPEESPPTDFEFGCRMLPNSNEEILVSVLIRHWSLSTRIGAGEASSKLLTLNRGENVTQICLGTKSIGNNEQCVTFLEWKTSAGRSERAGTEAGCTTTVFTSSREYPVLNGFYGYESEIESGGDKYKCIRRIAPIWGVAAI